MPDKGSHTNLLADIVHIAVGQGAQSCTSKNSAAMRSFMSKNAKLAPHLLADRIHWAMIDKETDEPVQVHRIFHLYPRSAVVCM